MAKQDEFVMAVDAIEEHVRTIAADGKSVRLRVFKYRTGKWWLEVIDRFGNATRWQDTFKTSELAFARAVTTIQEDGIQVFIGRPEAG